VSDGWAQVSDSWAQMTDGWANAHSGPRHCNSLNLVPGPASGVLQYVSNPKNLIQLAT